MVTNNDDIEKYEHLKGYEGKIVILKANDNSFPFWQQERTKYLYNGKITDQNEREILDNEIIIEFDYDDVENDTEKSESIRKEADYWIKRIKLFLIELGVYFYITDHKGKCSHIRLCIKGLEYQPHKYSSQYKLELVLNILDEIGFKSDILRLDRGLITSRAKLISLENKPHYKSKWNGEIEKVIFQNKSARVLGVKIERINEIIQKIERSNNIDNSLIKNEKISITEIDIEELKNIWKEHYKPGKRNSLVLAFGGLCHRKNLTIEESNDLLKKLLTHIGFEDHFRVCSNELSYGFNHKKEEVAVYYHLKKFGLQDEETRNLYNKFKACFKDKNPLKLELNKNDAEDPETDIELIEKSELIDFEFQKNILNNYTIHLPLYKELVQEFAYKGKDEGVVHIHIWYRCNSLIQKSIETRISSNISSDNHVHDLWIGSSGSGKGLKKSFEKYLCKKNDITHYEITSLSHKEQLIGRTTGKGIKKTSIKGILDAKSVQQDEAQNVINETDNQHAEAMRILRQAMDSYGNNELSKKLIDDTFEESLKYYSQARISQLIHPTNLLTPFFYTGSFRRYNAIIDLGSDNNIDIEGITKIKIVQENEKHPFTDSIGQIYEKQIDTLDYTQESLDIISDIHSLILELCLQHGNKHLQKYGLMTKHTLRILIMRYVNILHITYNKQVTEKGLTLRACMNFLHIWFSSVEAICKYGRLDINTEEWFGLDDKSIIALRYLVRKNAISEDKTNVTINRFQSVLAELYGVKMTQSRSIMRELQKKGFISSKQVGRTETKVWLLKIPKKIQISTEWFIPSSIIKFFEDKNLTDENGILLPSLKEIIDKNKIEKEMADKADTTNLTITNLYTYKITKLINFIINNYNMPIRVSALSPLNSINNSARDKNTNETSTQTLLSTDSQSKTQESMHYETNWNGNNLVFNTCEYSDNVEPFCNSKECNKYSDGKIYCKEHFERVKNYERVK